MSKSPNEKALRKLIKQAILMIHEARTIDFNSNVNLAGPHCGKVTDYDSVRAIRRYDTWLAAAQEALK